MQHELIPQRLRAERDRLKWTQRDLAEASGVSLRQIITLEKERPDEGGHPLRASTLTRLAAALGVDEDKLLLPLDGTENISARPRAKEAMTVRMGASQRLQYELLQETFGISRDEVIEAAPLLFMVAVEESLKWRKSQVSEARAHLERLCDAVGYLATAEQKEELERLREELDEEERSIRARELRRISDRDRHMSHASNRFMDYLTQACTSPDQIELIGVHKVGIDPESWTPPYNVCREKLYEVCGRPGEEGAEQATYALVMGSVRLADIPEHLRSEDRRAERIAWLGEQVDGPDEEWWSVNTYPSLSPATEYASTNGGYESLTPTASGGSEQ